MVHQILELEQKGFVDEAPVTENRPVPEIVVAGVGSGELLCNRRKERVRREEKGSTKGSQLLKFLGVRPSDGSFASSSRASHPV